MRRWVLLLVAAAGLVAAVPASASHHPPNSQTGLVTMSVARQRTQLTLSYTVTQRPCPNSSCLVNFGKPYRIAIYVDVPGRPTAIGTPTPAAVSVPANCSVQALPLVNCNAPARDESDPAAALPMSGVIRLRVGTVAGATAEIDAAGYSLNTYQEGISVPVYDCSLAADQLKTAEQMFIKAEQEYKQELHDLVKIENAALLRFRIGELYEHLRNRAIEDFHDAQNAATEAKNTLDSRRISLGECLEPARNAAARTSLTPAAACTDEEWAVLIERGRALRFKNVTRLVRKIRAEQRAKKHARAARDLRRLRALLRPEVKRLKALEKAVNACD
jgi:hypothetical protein